MSSRLIFLDTEFTGLGQRWPRLISIGLISEDGTREFYAELIPEGYLEKVSPWVRENVLPLLEGDAVQIAPADLAPRLFQWITSFGEPVQLAIDSMKGDWPWLEAIFQRPHTWPANLDRKPALLAKGYLKNHDAYIAAVESAFVDGFRQHHALDDAKAHRLGWIAAGGYVSQPE